MYSGPFGSLLPVTASHEAEMSQKQFLIASDPGRDQVTVPTMLIL